MDELPYRRLEAWQKAMDLAVLVREMARDERVVADRVVRDQMVRAAMSVAANLAEGHGRGTARDFAAFVDRARGSLFELDTWLELQRRAGAITDARIERAIPAILELNAMLFSLRASLRARARVSNER